MPDAPVENEAAQLVEALLAMDRMQSARVLERAARGLQTIVAVEGMISRALDDIGSGWERGDVSLAQVYLTAKMCRELLRPYMPDDTSAPTSGRALMVLEDQHVLGASIVRSVLSCAGFAPADWGPISTADAIERIQRERPSVVLVSTLMLRSALQVSKLTSAIRAAGLGTKVIVGGAPFRFDAQLWTEVGADAMGRTASDAVELVRTLSRRAA